MKHVTVYQKENSKIIVINYQASPLKPEIPPQFLTDALAITDLIRTTRNLSYGPRFGPDGQYTYLRGYKGLPEINLAFNVMTYRPHAILAGEVNDNPNQRVIPETLKPNLFEQAQKRDQDFLKAREKAVDKSFVKKYATKPPEEKIKALLKAGKGLGIAEREIQKLLKHAADQKHHR